MGTKSINALTNLPFGSIIGAPLTAAVEAQALAAVATVDFIKTVGFNPPKESNKLDIQDMLEEDSHTEEPITKEIGSIRNVSFYYQKEGADGKVKIEMQVPLLSIVPIPVLRIEEMTIDFAVKISEVDVKVNKKTTVTNRSHYSSGSRSGGGSFFGWGARGSSYSSSYSSTRHTDSEKEVSKYKMDTALQIHVKAVGDEMPAGLNKVLGILESSITENQTPLLEEGSSTSSTPNKASSKASA